MSHDPGDEDRRDVRVDGCVMCGRKLHWNNTWRVPVQQPINYSTVFKTVDAYELDHETLSVCMSERCRRLALQFSRSQGVNPDYKESQRVFRAMCKSGREYRAGKQP